MTEIITLDEWAADTRPVTLEVADSTFRVLPISFDEARHVNEQITAIEDVTPDALLDATISSLKFEGPDWWHRWRLRRAINSLDGMRKQIAATKLTNLFTEALRGHHNELQRQLTELVPAQG